MPSTSATIYLRPQLASGSSGARTTVANVPLAIRTTSGQFSSGFGIATTQDLNGKKTFKPHRSVPVVDSNGLLTENWNSYFDYLHRKFLNADSSATLPAIQEAITYSQAQTLVSEAVATALAQQANANAQTIAALRELVINAQISGAQQVPPPQLAPVVVVPPTAPIAPPVNDNDHSNSGGGGD